ncbi:type II secretion system protein [bacterium]|nr:type II secretion system protein [bacterium]
MIIYELRNRISNKSAFTLAETLIAMVVIGVVAAITIPSLISKKDRREWISALDKSFTVLANGLKNAEAVDGKVKNWGEENFYEYFMKGFKVLETCEDNTCVPDESYLNGESVTLPENSKSYILTDGQIMTLTINDPTCLNSMGTLEGVCGSIYIDVNGTKRPNTWGKDYFGFYVTQNGIIPFGAQQIDVSIQDGYQWVSQGCNNGEVVCQDGKTFNCANAATDETACNTCGGDWTTYTQAAYSTPVYAHQPETYKTTYSENGYAVASYTSFYTSRINHYFCYRSSWEKTYSYSSYCKACYYSSDSDSYYCYYTPATPVYASVLSYKVSTYKLAYKINYSIATYSHDYVSSYTHHDAVYSTSCPNASNDTVCLGYKYTQQWDCWKGEDGAPYDDDCNAQGTASSTSCNLSFKTTNALEDCNLDGRGTSCAAWTIVNGNMIYLDSKEVYW